MPNKTNFVAECFFENLHLFFCKFYVIVDLAWKSANTLETLKKHAKTEWVKVTCIQILYTYLPACTYMSAHLACSSHPDPFSHTQICLYPTDNMDHPWCLYPFKLLNPKTRCQGLRKLNCQVILSHQSEIWRILRNKNQSFSCIFKGSQIVFTSRCA